MGIRSTEAKIMGVFQLPDVGGEIQIRVFWSPPDPLSSFQLDLSQVCPDGNKLAQLRNWLAGKNEVPAKDPGEDKSDSYLYLFSTTFIPRRPKQGLLKFMC